MVLENKQIHKKLSLAVALASIPILLYGLYYSHFVRSLQLPISVKKAGPTQFLTALSGHLTLYYFIFSAIGFLSAKIFYFKNQFLLPIVLGAEFIVTLVFWSLRLLFVSLIAHGNTVNGNKNRFSLVIDITLHAYPLIGLAVDYLCFSERIEISVGAQYLLCLSLALGYWCWLDFLIDITDGVSKYPYPFLNVDPFRRSVIFLLIATLAFVGVLLFGKLYDLTHKKQSYKEKKKQQ